MQQTSIIQLTFKGTDRQMLNMFLVLGQIPGTSHQLSFNEIIFGLLLSIELYLIYRHRALFLSHPCFSRFKRNYRLPIQLQLFK